METKTKMNKKTKQGLEQLAEMYNSTKDKKTKAKYNLRVATLMIDNIPSNEIKDYLDYWDKLKEKKK